MISPWMKWSRITRSGTVGSGRLQGPGGGRYLSDDVESIVALESHADEQAHVLVVLDGSEDLHVLSLAVGTVKKKLDP